MWLGPTCNVFLVWIAQAVFQDLALGFKIEDDAEYSINRFEGGRVKRRVETAGDDCFLPPPLDNGKFYPSARRCRPEDSSPACQMVPGTPVPHNWVIFFYCDPGFTLNSSKPVSVCLDGRWKPPLPTCQVGAVECATHDECPGDKTCIVGKCADSCDGLCGPNTACEITNHRPLCSCNTGYVGNPFKGCILGDPISVKLLITQTSQVSVLDLNLQKIVSVLHYGHQNGKKNSFPSVAYHYGKQLVFYTGPNQIFRDEVVGSLTRKCPPVAVVESGVDANVKLAVDWVHDKLYWMSHTDGTIEVSDLDGHNRTTLKNSGLTFNWDLNNIVVDPYAGYLFLVSDDAVHRMNLDGTNFTRLHLAGEDNRGVYVITLDTHKRRIYFSSWDLESAAPYIDSSDYDGGNGKDVPIGDRWGEIHAIDVFRDTVFFGHFRRGQADQVWSIDTSSPSPTPIKIKDVEKGFLGLKVYHPEIQKES